MRRGEVWLIKNELLFVCRQVFTKSNPIPERIYGFHGLQSDILVALDPRVQISVTN
jgi:hypothetical protein